MVREKIFSLVVATLAFSPIQALAAPIDDLVAALKMPELFQVLSEEGQVYGKTLEDQMFPGEGGARWGQIVGVIHEAERLKTQSVARMGKELEGKEALVSQMTAFFTSPEGVRVIDSEVAARKALVDENLREIAEAAYADLETTDSQRVEQYERLIKANDLIEQNVAGAMNSNLAFLRGMSAAGGIDGNIPEAELMADLWAQEPQIRAETEGWMSAYSTLAYGRLSLQEVESYVAFSASEAGQALNHALFAAFNETFDATSFEMGMAVVRFAEGQDI